MKVGSSLLRKIAFNNIYKDSDSSLIYMKEGLIRSNRFISSNRGGFRANLKEGQLVAGVPLNFQKLVTRVRCFSSNHFRSIMGINNITLR